jgi:hypothetical protein
MALLTVNQVSLTGVAVAPGAAAVGGDTFANNGKTVLEVTNASGSDKTVTIDSLVNCNQGSDHDIAVTVATGTTKRIGPFDPSRFNNSSGLVSVTYSGVTSVTVAAVSV